MAMFKQGIFVLNLGNAIFLKQIDSGTHRVTQNSVAEEEVLVIRWQEKVPERRSGLHRSEKVLQERRSVTKYP
jgi:hypothetical protein